MATETGTDQRTTPPTPEANGAPGRESFEVVNPADHAVIATVPIDGPERVREVAARVRARQPQWEGLGIGVIVATGSVWYASRTYDGNWITGTEGLLLGLAVAFAAPLGDLFESVIKRDVGTKDTGGLFGVHGGALDRLDAALFSLIAGYHVWLATVT